MPSFTVAAAHSVGFLSGSETHGDAAISSFASIEECFRPQEKDFGMIDDSGTPTNPQRSSEARENGKTIRTGSVAYEAEQDEDEPDDGMPPFALARSVSAFERSESLKERRSLRVPPSKAEFLLSANDHDDVLSAGPCSGLEAKVHAPDQLYSIRQVPYYVRMPDIWEGYRASGLRTAQYVKSLFRVHNETFNFWSHAVPAFVGAFVVMPYTILVLMRPLSIQARVSVFLYLLAAILCFTCSAIYHAVGCQSREVHKYWLMIDNVATLAYMTGSFLPGMVIVSLRFLRLGQACLILSIANFFVGTRIIVKNSKSERQCLKTRDLLFMVTAAWSLVPYGIFAFAERDELLGKVFLSGVVCSYCVQICAFGIYKLRLPERFGPGEFDCWGNSHHYWHILTCAGGLIWLTFVLFFFLQAFASNYHVSAIDEMGFLHQPY